MLKMLISYYGSNSSHNAKFLYLLLLQTMLVLNDLKYKCIVLLTMANAISNSFL